MGFDDEVDAARARLRAAFQEEEPAFNALSVLQPLLSALTAKLQSRRLALSLSQDEDDGPVIAVSHTLTDEDLGYVVFEDGEYVFESALEDYFDDFVDDDQASFVDRLYETLRADMAKYEIETELG
jgi:hypothetical protein